jgi:CRP-like cAMP-binding protein
MHKMSATTLLIETLNQIIPLTDEEKQLITKYTRKRVFQKDRYLLQAGQISSSVFFVIQGLVRAYYKEPSSHEEITSWFIAEGGFICSVKSYVGGNPSFENIIAEEDTTVLEISKADTQILIEHSANLARVILAVTERYLCIYDDRTRSLKLTSEERYWRFQEQNPMLINRLKPEALASYLDMSRSMLFKIRKKKK